MNELLHANIFFFIASCATVLFCLLIAIILYQAIKILQSIRRIMERIEAGSEKIAHDIDNVRTLITNGGMLSRAIGFIMGVTQKGSRKRRRHSEE